MRNGEGAHEGRPYGGVWRRPGLGSRLRGNNGRGRGMTEGVGCELDGVGDAEGRFPNRPCGGGEGWVPASARTTEEAWGYWGREQTSRAVRVRTLATFSMSLMRMYSSGMVSDSEPPPGPKRRQGTPACQRWHVSSPV